MTGPDLTNGLISVLLKLRKDKVAIHVTADIEQMFFNFYEKDKKIINDSNGLKKTLTMDLLNLECVSTHSANSPSAAVATIGLQKSECDLCNEVCEL